MPQLAGKSIVGIIAFLTTIAITVYGQTPSLHSTTQLVEIDTIATDSHGKAVDDLKSSDIQLFEDGVERALSHFSLEKVEPLDEKAAQRMHELAHNKKPGVYANFTPETAAVPRNGCTVLLIDWLNTPVELQPSAQQELKKFIETVNLSKPLAVYALDMSLHLVQGFTMDRQMLKSSVENYGLHSASLQPEKQATHSLNSELTDIRVSKSVAALLSIANNISGIQGHKSLIWLSGSFPTALIPTDLTGLNPDMERWYGGYVYGDRRNYSGIITQVSRAISAENIAIYPVDALGLQGGMTDASQFSFQFFINPIYQASYERQESMRDVADLTGGRAFYNHNDIGHEIDAAYNDANNFYALAFTPAKSKPDGKVHSVHLKCRRAGVHLRYRRSYYADNRQSLAQTKRAVLEQLVRTPGESADGLPMMAQIDKQNNDRVSLWLDGSSLSIMETQSPSLLVDIAVATFDNQDALLKENYVDMKIKINPEQLHEVQTGGLSQTLQFSRTKETARVRIAIRDLASGRVGALEIMLH